MNDKKKAVASIMIGGIAGGTTSSIVGGMGLAVLGTGVAVGMLPLIGFGSVVGLATFGAYKAFSKPKQDV